MPHRSRLAVRKAGGRVRITGQLIDAATGAHLWADRFDGSLDDIFELQDKGKHPLWAAGCSVALGARMIGAKGWRVR